jgi:hypothetical protein
MKIEISLTIIFKVCIYLLSFIFIFPFLIVIGWHIRGFYDNKKYSEHIDTPLRSDTVKMDKETGVVIV